MRRGIADLHRRVQVSQGVNGRLIDALATVDDSHRLEELVSAIQKPTHWNGRRVRALRPFADDYTLLQAIQQGDFLIDGFRNRDLQALLFPKPAESPQEQRRRSAAISRRLRMLRAHGLIHKISGTHRYQVSASARTLLIAVTTSARTTLQQINRLHEEAA
ncbi:MAG TPA: hypothetical protein VKU01_25825 [Bryobacteraceae bacterium]|nr:hypothetical protein [Bryobacteraceae bacterium]